MGKNEEPDMTSSELKRVNYHTHCRRCRHARGEASEYAEEAIRKGLSVLGFSDHLPFPFDRYGGMRMPYAELEEYLEEITILKEKLKDRIHILRGFEGEFIKSQTKYYECLLSHDQCDYLIFGQHFFETDNENFLNTYSLDNTEQYEIYAESIVEGMRSGYFRYAAHPDLIFVNDHPWDIHCDRACDIIINGALKYDFALEYNANGPRQGKRLFADGERDMYPYPGFWDKAEGTGIRVYVGSDCHEPEAVYDSYVESAYADLEKRKISVSTELEPLA